jgi:small-conductance mechanosensitive channel
MSRYNKATLGLYLVALTIAILSGFSFGFTAGSHTPPMPFLIEVCVICVGLVWLLIDTVIVSVKRTQTWKDIIGHMVGLSINAGFVVYLISPIFFR